MAVTDSRVKFLRGQLASLPTAKTDGNIYITTDERAMYVDYKDSNNTVQRIRLGDFREYDTWAQIQALTDTGGTYASATDKLSTTALYYAKTENILAKWTGTNWKQINPQQSITSLIHSITESVSVSSNTATITTTVKNGSQVNVFTPSHSITTADADAIKLTATGNNSTLTIRGRNVTNTVTPSVAADGTVTIVNTYTGTDSSGNTVNTTSQNGTFKIAYNSNGGVKVTGNASTGTITLDSDYRIVGSTANTNKSLVLGLSNINSNGVVPTDSQVTLTPTITVGSGTTTTVNALVGYTAGTKVATIGFTLPVYTKTQVDNLIATQLKSIDSMTFMGNIKSSGGTVTTPPLAQNTVKIGDTYIVAEAGTYDIDTATPTATTQSARVGDLFIATSTNTTNPENSLGFIEPADIKWVYVPSGDDIVHAYELKKGTSAAVTGANAQAAFDYIYLKNEANIMQGPGIGIGSGIEYDTLTSNDGNSGSVIVLKHKVYSTPTATAGTATTLNQTTTNGTLTGSITAITGITVENGHITGYTTKQFGITMASAWTNSRLKASISNSKGVLTSQHQTAASTTVWVDDQALSLSSSSLTYAKVSDTELSINLMWETF